MTNVAIGRSAWAGTPFYKFLRQTFPAQQGKCGFFDVLGLAKRLNLSGEAVYQWVRKGKLTPINAKQLFDLASSEENLKALAECDPPRTAPKIEDFLPFFFSA